MGLRRITQHLKSARVRAVFLFDGSPTWLQFHKRAIFANDDSTLYLSDSNEKAVPVHRYRDYLGSNNNFVLLEFTEVVHADALAALAGTVNGGGILFVFLPEADTPFKQRIVRSVRDFHRIELIRPEDDLRAITSKLLEEDLPTLEKQVIPSQAQKEI